MADDARYEQLVKKRGTVGLSDAEANELGKILAERAGKGEEYFNAQSKKGQILQSEERGEPGEHERAAQHEEDSPAEP